VECGCKHEQCNWPQSYSSVPSGQWYWRSQRCLCSMHVPSSHLHSSAVHSLGGGCVGAAVHIQTTQHINNFNTCNRVEENTKWKLPLRTMCNLCKNETINSQTYGSQIRQCRRDNDIDCHNDISLQCTFHHHISTHQLYTLSVEVVLEPLTTQIQ